VLVYVVPVTPLAIRFPLPGVNPLAVLRYTLYPVIVHGGFAGAAVQVRPMELEVAAEATRLVGPVGGTELQVAAASVSMLICPDGADAPYEFADSTA
jgi:hypothetical protein